MRTPVRRIDVVDVTRDQEPVSGAQGRSPHRSGEFARVRHESGQFVRPLRRGEVELELVPSAPASTALVVASGVHPRFADRVRALGARVTRAFSAEDPSLEYVRDIAREFHHQSTRR